MRRRARPILDLARRGAEARERVVHEVGLLLQAFPHLREAFDKHELAITFIVAKGSGRLTKRTRTAPKK